MTDTHGNTINENTYALFVNPFYFQSVCWSFGYIKIPITRLRYLN